MLSLTAVETKTLKTGPMEAPCGWGKPPSGSRMARGAVAAKPRLALQVRAWSNWGQAPSDQAW